MWPYRAEDWFHARVGCVQRAAAEKLKNPGKIVMALDIFSPESAGMINTKADSKADTTVGRIRLNT